MVISLSGFVARHHALQRAASVESAGIGRVLRGAHRVLSFCIEVVILDRTIGERAWTAADASSSSTTTRASARCCAEYLGGHGYDVRAADSGAAMRAEIERDLPDLVLLDIRLPGEDGLTLARYLRERYDVGIIMVTASGDVVDRVVGLEVGADDYVAKPFDPRELLARVKSVLRRMQARTPRRRCRREPASARRPPRRPAARACASAAARSTSTRAACSKPTATKSRSRRWSSTCCASFLANPNRVLSRDQLLHAHAQPRVGAVRPLDRHPHRPPAPQDRARPDGEPRCIRTVRNAGYMYVPL